MKQDNKTPWWKTTEAKVAIAASIIGGIFTIISVLPSWLPSDDSTEAQANGVAPPSPSQSSLVQQEPPISTVEENPTTIPEPQIQYLSNMEYVDGYSTNGSRSLNGRDYSHSVSTSIDGECGPKIKPRIIEYQLDKQWRTFDTTLFLSRETHSGTKVRFTTYVDGSPAGNAYTLETNMERHLTVDLSNASRLKLEMIYVGGAEELCQVGYAVWGEAMLIK